MSSDQFPDSGDSGRQDPRRQLERLRATSNLEQGRGPQIRKLSVRKIFLHSLNSTAQLSIEECLDSVDEPVRESLFCELLEAELAYRQQRGEAPRAEDYLPRFADYRVALGRVFGRFGSLETIDSGLQLPDDATGNGGGSAATDFTIDSSLDTVAPRDTESALEATIDSAAGNLRDTAKNEPDATVLGDSLPPITDAMPADDRRRQFGDYELLDEIARGGMGVVFRVRQRRLNRVVALKMIRSGNLASEEEVRRFYAEAEAAAQLDHPGIVPIYEVGECQGQHFFSMGFVDGTSLHHRVLAQPYAPAEAAALMATISDAVHFAHERGIVHRDLKPANILLTQDGQPKITDFGLAKAVDLDSGLTASGQVLGTPSYMPPEQALGDREQTGPSSDIYALGGVLYFLLTGRPPFQAASVMETLKQVLEHEPVSPRVLNPSVDRDLETICMKCLAKEPKRRYASAAEVAAELRRVVDGEPILARPMGHLERSLRWCKRRPMTVGLGIASVIAALAIGGAVLLAHRAGQSEELAELMRQYQGELDELDLNENYLEKMELLSGQIERFDPAAATDAKQRLYRAFSERVRGEILKPKLRESDFEQLQLVLDAFAQRAPEDASDLQQLLQDRYTGWQPLFQLTAQAELEDAARFWPEGQLVAAAEGPGFQLAEGPDEPETAPATVPSRAWCSVPSEGNVQFSVTLAEPWRHAPRLALAFGVLQAQGPGEGSGEGPDENADGESAEREAGERVLSGYEFVLLPSGATAGETFADVAARQGNVLLEIRRDGIRVKKVELPASDLQGDLRLFAERDATRISFQVNHQTPLVLDELFLSPFREGERFGLQAPADVRVLELAAFQKARSDATPLEQGDGLYHEGEYTRALGKYREQEVTSTDPQIQRESVFKQGLCLAKLQRDGEALQVFATIASSDEPPWPALASTQIWLLHLKAERWQEADGAFESLASRFRFDELVALIPEDERHKMIDAYNLSIEGGYLGIRHQPDRVVRLRRILEVHQLLDQDSDDVFVAKWNLMDAYQLEEQFNEAATLARELLVTEDLSALRRALLIESCVWVLMDLEAYDEALQAIDRWLLDENGVYQADYLRLLIERARVNAAWGRLQDAQTDIDVFFFRQPRIKHMQYIEACIVRGFVYHQLGDELGARWSWRSGFETARRARKYMGTLPVAMMGSLSGEYTSDDAQATMRAVTSSGVNSHYMNFLRQKLAPDELVHTVLLNMYQSPRGFELARRVAMHQVSASDANQLQVLATMAELWRQCVTGDSALDAPISDEETEVVWRFAQGAWDAFQAQELSETNVLQVAMTWRGTTSVFGWSGLAPNLTPELRAHAAYVFGCRYKHLGRVDDARMFFETVIQDVPQDATLYRLAETELASLDAASSSSP